MRFGNFTLIRLLDLTKNSRSQQTSCHLATPEPVEISHPKPEISPTANETNVAGSKLQEEIKLPSAAIPEPIEPPADQLPSISAFSHVTLNASANHQFYLVIISSNSSDPKIG